MTEYCSVEGEKKEKSRAGGGGLSERNWLVLLAALAIRLLVIAIGYEVDRRFHVQYTDVDYFVFSDAARHVVEGRSPFERPSYRYSPVLAWMLTGNIYLHPSFGKVLFSVFDTLCITETCSLHALIFPGAVRERAWLGWLLCMSPIAIAICTRGSCDAISNFLVLATLRSVMTFKGQGTNLSACLGLAAAIHFRVYPAIYLPALALAQLPRSPTPWLQRPLRALIPAVRFVAVTVALVGAFALLGGPEYVQHALLHHVGRADHRHNFSPYFLPIYLAKSTSLAAGTGAVVTSLSLSLLPFALQASLVLTIALKFAESRLPLCLLLQTMAFVAWNKVITAQYFLWYACLLPLALSPAQMTNKRLALAAMGWTAAAALWLWRGYQLEMLGLPVLVSVWQASLIFCAAHTLLIMAIVAAAR